MKNQTLEIIFNRSSCRNFSERKVSQNDLEEMIAAGLSAPSSGNFQAYSIIHVTDAEKKPGWHSFPIIKNLLKKRLLFFFSALIFAE